MCQHPTPGLIVLKKKEGERETQKIKGIENDSSEKRDNKFFEAKLALGTRQSVL